MGEGRWLWEGVAQVLWDPLGSEKLEGDRKGGKGRRTDTASRNGRLSAELTVKVRGTFEGGQRRPPE